MSRVVILGGYGNVGLRVARALAARPALDVVIAGRDAVRANGAATALSREAGRPVVAAVVDARSPESSRRVFDGAALVVAASSTSDYASVTARAALDASTDYLDTQLSTRAKLAALRQLAPEILARGRCFITDAGFHPGLPGAMVRYAAERLSGISRADVGGSFNLAWRRLQFSDSASTEFMAELRDMDNAAFVDGRWQRNWRLMRWFDFGPPAGRQQCVPMCLEELRGMPAEISTLRGTGFYIGGFGRFVDNVLMPALLVTLKLAPRSAPLMGRLFLGAMRRFTATGEWAILLLEAEAPKGSGTTKARLRISHADPYELTALPVIACIDQYLNGRRRPGLFTQAAFVDPTTLIAQLRQGGVAVSFELDGCAQPIEA